MATLSASSDFRAYASRKNHVSAGAERANFCWPSPLAGHVDFASVDQGHTGFLSGKPSRCWARLKCLDTNLTETSTKAIVMQRIFFVVLISSVIGCFGGTEAKGPVTAPASGIVTLDGKPLAGAVVMFLPTGATQGVESVATTDAAGKFQLKTITGDPGVIPGEHRVLINKMVMPDGSPIPTDTDEPEITFVSQGARELVPQKYNNRETSILKATVPATGGDSFNFDLKSK